MSRVLVWDLPIRLFHVLFGLSVLTSAATGFFVDDESPLFLLHPAAGLTAGLLLVLRLVWAVVGSRTAGPAGLNLSPAALVDYLRGVAKGAPTRHLGHNPASSLAILGMAGLLLGLVLSGVTLARGSEALEEVHELLAWGMVAVVAAHILGALLHGLRVPDGTLTSMIDGHKEGEPADGIPSARPLAALALLLLTGAWVGRLALGADPAAGTLDVPLLGALSIGEGGEGGEHGEGSGGREGQGEEDEDEDEDEEEDD